MVEQTQVHTSMTDARRKRLLLLARVISGLTVLGIVVGLWLSTIDRQPTDMGLVLAFALFPIVGYLMATRRPDNSLSWLMLGIGAAIGIGAFLGSYAGYAVHGGIGGRHLGLIAEALNNPMWVPVVGLPATFLLLLFPGRTSAVPAVAMVRAHPRREPGDRLADHRPGPREVRR